METLTRRKRGKPLKYDFSMLQEGEVIQVKGRNVRKNPNAYISYWNKNNPDKQVEVVVNEKGIIYFRLKPL